MISKEKTMSAIETMYEMFPEAHGELVSKNAFELLIAVILSAQATDVSVNKVTPALFEAYPTPQALSEAPLEDVIAKIKSIGHLLCHSSADRLFVLDGHRLLKFAHCILSSDVPTFFLLLLIDYCLFFVDHCPVVPSTFPPKKDRLSPIFFFYSVYYLKVALSILKLIYQFP